MKKVLILAYDFPPYVSVGGLRPMGWAKYLKQENIQPIVITRNWDQLNGNNLDYIQPSKSKTTVLVETETHIEYRVPFSPNRANKLRLKYGPEKFKTLRKLLNAWNEIGQFFLPIGNKRSLYTEAKLILSKEKDIAVIVATGDPFVLFHYGKKLQNKFKIPCLIDYRDPWSQDVYLQKEPLLSKINKYIEKRTLKTITHVTTVSTFLVENLKKLHSNKEFSVIANGFDLESALNASRKKQNNQVLNISFVGTIYVWYPFELFLETLQEIKNEHHINFKLNLLGIDQVDYVQKLLSNKFKSISENVFVTAKIPNEQLLEELATNNLLILFNSFSFLGTKIYDYIAINRKTLLLFTNDPITEELKRIHFQIKDISSVSNTLQADMLVECNAGIPVKDPTHLKELLIAFNKEFQENGFIANQSSNFEHYSRQAQTKKLAKLLHSISK